ncbi:MAG: hypothetical protein Q4G50_13105 [Corynebacterium sp.]|uniref:WYL domain-containing protein n=1 Tax=Corynebacterium sp. TaxID=1720 RepID=UPI0026DF75FB|nr:hypothetical protein [Corynebacterium sp.]MDO5670922.1 hypothetical protein [Corynebacterium sp.]
MTPAEHLLYALPLLGESFMLDDAAEKIRVLDPCGWPVPAHRDKLAFQLEDLVLAGRLDTDGTYFQLPAHELLTLSEHGLPEHPIFEVTDWTVNLRQALSRSAAALILLAHRLRRSLPQNYPAGSAFATAAGYLLDSPRFRDAVAGQAEPLVPAFLLAAAAREATHPIRSEGAIPVGRLLGWEVTTPELDPVRRALATDSEALPEAEYAALLDGANPGRWIVDKQELGRAELYIYPAVEIRTPIVRAQSPVRALGRSYLYAFEATQFASTRAASDPLLADYDPQVIGGGLMATRRDAAPLFRTLGIVVEDATPPLSLRTRLEIARTETELADYFAPEESQILAAAVTLGTAVVIEYRDEVGVDTQRMVTNPTLVNKSLLRGYCHLRGDDRMFRLDRIMRIAQARLLVLGHQRQADGQHEDVLGQCHALLGGADAVGLGVLRVAEVHGEQATGEGGEGGAGQLVGHEGGEQGGADGGFGVAEPGAELIGRQLGQGRDAGGCGLLDTSGVLGGHADLAHAGVGDEGAGHAAEDGIGNEGH